MPPSFAKTSAILFRWAGEINRQIDYKKDDRRESEREPDDTERKSASRQLPSAHPGAPVTVNRALGLHSVIAQNDCLHLCIAYINYKYAFK